jgi:hypothetical protein
MLNYKIRYIEPDFEQPEGIELVLFDRSLSNPIVDRVFDAFSNYYDIHDNVIEKELMTDIISDFEFWIEHTE